MKLENDKTLVRSTRAAYADALLQLGAETDDVVVLDADLSESTMTCKFAEKYPDKFYNMGIAEQSMMGTAAGLATCGLTPICSTFSVFACLRSGEQVRTSIAYPKLNVKIVTTHSGLSIGTAGATHFCEEDLAIMRAIPNMTVIAPSDYLETVKAVKAAVAYPGPVYIRLGRGDAPVLYSELEDYQIGKAITYKDGSDITLIATGVMMQRAIAAADLLEAKGVSCRIIDMHTIKPFDHESVEKAAKETKAIITLEEHNINGGLGSAVAETVAAVKGEKAVVKILGIPDVFGGVASAELLWDSYHMDADSVCNIALDLLK
ncbi:transketolase subunit B [Oscillibacter sp. PC13]|uniref:transketolase family protein n=1 Tax=Oscillibacter sp. PC13 TaxID=1855299 RepID=UPI0008F0A4D2|nr:transketolase C-terminal domain-containing protein [Oscillibacter sp. PC13]SFP69418.1 transketolase subunit B [Oscillibacter sp. PC13]